MRHSENGEASSNSDLLSKQNGTCGAYRLFVCDINSIPLQQQATFINYVDLNRIYKLHIKYSAVNFENNRNCLFVFYFLQNLQVTVLNAN
jgi:hypothetical protein